MIIARTRIIILFIFLLLSAYIPRDVFALIPSDRFYPEQWYLKKIRAEEAWDVTTGSRDIVIAVIDTGIDIDHADLAPNIWVNEDENPGDGVDNDRNGFIDDRNGWDFLANVPDPQPKFTDDATSAGMHHGTIVSGIIAAAGSNREGITGISFRSRIMPLRALDGRGIGEASAVTRAVEYAYKNGADIINLSFVGNEPATELAQALRTAYDRGVLIVSASGNDTAGAGIDLDVEPKYPVCADAGNPVNYIISVAALTDDDRRAPFSNFGSHCVDITAPGTRFIATQFFVDDTREGYNKLYGGWWSGTSLAAPVVSGALALLKSAAPNLTNAQLSSILLRTADSIASQNPDIASEKLGAGRVNIARALQEIGGQRSVVLPVTSNFQKIVTGAGFGGGPHVRVFDANGELRAQFFAYDPRFRGGVRVATGDTDADGRTDIVTGAGPGGGPHVRVFTEDGRFKNHFFVDDARYRGGVQVAVGDINSDRRGDIVVGFGRNKEPIVKVFSSRGDLLIQFLAFAPEYRGGLRVAVGDVNGDGQDEILVTRAEGGDAIVRVFRGDGTLLSQFSAFEGGFPGGINLAATDVNRDGRDEIVAVPGAGGGPHVRVFDGSGSLKGEFFAFPETTRVGMLVSGVDMGGGQRGIAVAPASGMIPLVRLFTAQGVLTTQLLVYDERFRGGVIVAGGN